MDNLRFSIPEILSLMGVAQCVYLFVYIAFRSGSLQSVFLPALYFLVLGGAFALDVAGTSVAPLIPGFMVWHWALWFMGPPISALLILQILQLPTMPPLKNFWVLLLIPAAFLISQAIGMMDDSCHKWNICRPSLEWLVVTGLVAGLLSIIVIWSQRRRLSSLRHEKAGPDRYWLIMTLIFMNLGFLGLMLFSLAMVLTEAQVTLVRTILGLGFVYVAGTSLLRIYPQAILLIQRGERKTPPTATETDLVARIRELIDVQKIYQEPECNRTTLARELNVPEGTLSRVVNTQFGKSVPQLLNECRIDDAKRLLTQTDAPIKVIADEVGFSSLASFNRVFKDMTGESPSAFRANK